MATAARPNPTTAKAASTPEQGGMSNEDGSEGSGSDSNTLTGTDGTRAAKLTITLAIFGSAACLAGIVLMVARKLKC